MSGPRIEMYATSWCPYCERARQLLRSKGVSFEEISIESDPAQREIMIRRCGRRTVPQIFIAGAHVGDSDELHALDAAGGLDPLITQPQEISTWP